MSLLRTFLFFSILLLSISFSNFLNNSCGTIWQSGTYTVNNSLIQSTGGSCIIIAVSNVVLNLNGSTITNATTGSDALLIYNSSTLISNIKVANGTLNGSSIGAEITNVQNLTLQNLTISSMRTGSTVAGLVLSHSYNFTAINLSVLNISSSGIIFNNVTNVTFANLNVSNVTIPFTPDDTSGIPINTMGQFAFYNISTNNYLTGSPMVFCNLIINCNNSVISNASFVFISSGQNITLENLTIRNVTNGIVILNSTQLKLKNLSISDTNIYGLYAFSMNLSNLTRLNVTAGRITQNYGVYLHNSTQNELSDSSIFLSSDYGLALVSSNLTNVTNLTVDQSIVIQISETPFAIPISFYLENSSDNIFRNNTGYTDATGFYLLRSPRNTINNTILFNYTVAIGLNFTNQTSFHGNSINLSVRAILSYDSYLNNFTRLNLTNNSIGFDLFRSSSNSIFDSILINHTSIALSLNSSNNTLLSSSTFQSNAFDYESALSVGNLINYSTFNGTLADLNFTGDLAIRSLSSSILPALTGNDRSTLLGALNLSNAASTTPTTNLTFYYPEIVESNSVEGYKNNGTGWIPSPSITGIVLPTPVSGIYKMLNITSYSSFAIFGTPKTTVPSTAPPPRPVIVLQDLSLSWEQVCPSNQILLKTTAGASVSLSHGSDSKSLTADSSGNALFDSFGEGAYSATAKLEEYNDASLSFIYSSCPSKTLQLSLSSSCPDQIVASVLESGFPVEGALVSLIAGPQRQTVLAPQSSDSSGKAYFKFSTPGLYEFEASKDGYSTDSSSVSASLCTITNTTIENTTSKTPEIKVPTEGEAKTPKDTSGSSTPADNKTPENESKTVESDKSKKSFNPIDSVRDALVDFTSTNEGKAKLALILVVIMAGLYYYLTRYKTPKFRKPE